MTEKTDKSALMLRLICVILHDVLCTFRNHGDIKLVQKRRKYIQMVGSHNHYNSL